MCLRVVNTRTGLRSGERFRVTVPAPGEQLQWYANNRPAYYQGWGDAAGGGGLDCGALAAAPPAGKCDLSVSAGCVEPVVKRCEVAPACPGRSNASAWSGCYRDNLTLAYAPWLADGSGSGYNYNYNQQSAGVANSSAAAAVTTAVAVTMTPLQFLPWEIKSEEVGHLCVMPSSSSSSSSSCRLGNKASSSGCLLQPRACSCADAAKVTNRPAAEPPAITGQGDTDTHRERERENACTEAVCSNCVQQSFYIH
jgi:hypothetical protein